MGDALGVARSVMPEDVNDPSRYIPAKNPVSFKCDLAGELNGMWGKKHTEETRAKISKVLKERAAPPSAKNRAAINASWDKPGRRERFRIAMKQSRARSPSPGAKGLFWWNNGVEQVRSKECPDGWVRGRLKVRAQLPS